jgi:glucose uptake protein GlcU
MWNVGNICSILVTVSPLGLTIGLPLGQLALVGACVIGIVLFKEVEGWLRLALFSGCVAVTAAAAVLLGVYGRCKECAPLA